MLAIITSFILAKTIEIIWICSVYVFGKLFLNLLVRRLTKVSTGATVKNKNSLAKRTETLKKIIQVNGGIVLEIIFFLMVLNLFGLNVGPILAGLGVAGLAIGFGAQALVKDFVGGLLVLVENQYNIGDKVKIGDITGKVDKITLRSTILKDEDGRVCYIANGGITNVMNYSQK